MNSFTLKPDMLLGVTLAGDREGAGETNWTRWHARGRIKDGSDPASDPGRAENARSDLLTLHRMGIRSCLVQVRWERLEPECEVFDPLAMEQFKSELVLLRALGVEPVLSLSRFTLPAWFEKCGGWTNVENIRYYLHYAEFLVRSVGHLVREYITLEDPNQYAVCAYQQGLWPPGQKDFRQAAQVMSILAAAHIQAYQTIRDVRHFMGFDDTKVGFSLRMAVFQPLSGKNPIHRANSALTERFFQLDMAKAMLTGVFGGSLKDPAGAPVGLYGDFIGMSYYTRISVAAGGEGERNRAPKNDIGWEIYPQGIVQCAQKLCALAPLPLYITGNGACDGSDSFRSRFLYEHLGALCLSALPVGRYYYRSFLDGFEGVEGRAARFGLIQVDPDTGERRVRPSCRFYSRILAEGGVSESLYNEFVAGQCYHYLTSSQIQEMKTRKKPVKSVSQNQP